MAADDDLADDVREHAAEEVREDDAEGTGSLLHRATEDVEAEEVAGEVAVAAVACLTLPSARRDRVRAAAHPPPNAAQRASRPLGRGPVSDIGANPCRSRPRRDAAQTRSLAFKDR